MAGVRESIWAIDKDQPIGDIKTMNQVIEAKAAGDRFLGWMLAGFASTGLGLATIGIFGVVAYTVAQRTHEIGVRMAFGAQKGNIFRLIVGRGNTSCYNRNGSGIDRCSFRRSNSCQSRLLRFMV